MKGKHHIVIETARIRYAFDIRRNITVIKGDSATGKTTLITLLQAYSARGKSSGVQFSSDVPCAVYSGDMNSWKNILPSYHSSIIFIDEDYSFISSKDFAGLIQGTDNYYVLITRRDLVNLPYSIDEIYGIRTSGKYHFPKKIYNEFYRIYPDEYISEVKHPVLITEDSNSGFQFFSRTCSQIKCISAGGNSNIFKTIEQSSPDTPIAVIADGAAFGAFISKVLSAARLRKNVSMYFPESFEWMILRSGIIHSKSISEILEAPENFIESSIFFSWEQYFTGLLEKTTSNDEIERYHKTELPGFYTGRQNAEKIMQVLPEDFRAVLQPGSLQRTDRTDTGSGNRQYRGNCKTTPDRNHC